MDMLPLGQAVLNQQPFNRMMGVRLVQLADGVAEMELELRGDLLQQHGFAHGGVVASMADNALAYAGGTRFGNVVTAEFKLNYLRPAVGDKIIARASVVHAGKSQATVRCDVYAVQDGLEKVCATALGTINRSGVDLVERTTAPA